MKVNADFSGLDEFLTEAENEIKKGMIEAAHEGVDYAKKHGEYKNHTHNLRSAPGAAVVMETPEKRDNTCRWYGVRLLR